MKNQLAPHKVLLLVLTCALFTACDSGPKSATSLLSSVSPTPTPVVSTTETDTDAPANSPLFLTVGARWEGETTWADIDKCSVLSTAPVGTDTACAITLEEGRMYYSDIRFTVGTKTEDTCEIISFRPYYYQRSDNAAYTPKGASSPVDCSVATDIPLACYGGAAPAIVSDFPNSTGNYFLSANETYHRFTISSENSMRVYGGDWVNYLLTNDISDKTIGSAAGDAQDYVADTMRDYKVYCRDRFGKTLQTLTLTFQDEDKDGSEHDAAEDQFADWY